MLIRIASSLACLAALAVAGCGDDADAGTDEQVRVVAATSLKGAVETLATEYEAAHPETELRISFAASDQIQEQIEGGLDADVIAMASGKQIKPLLADDLAKNAVPFTSNKLAIAVGENSDADIETAGDLEKKSKLSLGESGAPIGGYADEAIAALAKRYGSDWKAAVEDNVANRAPNAADVITPVALGGADAAISYVTDLKANEGRVRAVEIPDWAQPSITYWIAEGAQADPAGAEFISFIKSPDGQGVLQKKGFLAVPAAVGSEP